MKRPNKPLLILLAVWVPCFTLAAVAGLFVLGPQSRRVQDLDAQLAAERRLYNLALVAANPEAQGRLTAAVDKLNRRVFDFAVSWEGADTLALGIVQVANQMGLGSFSMRPRGRQEFEPAPSCDYLGEKQIDVTFTASFPAFAAFMNAMERYRPVLFVETFTILRPQLQSSEPQANLQLVLLVEKPQNGKARPAVGCVLDGAQSSAKVCLGVSQATDRPGPQETTRDQKGS
jgi:hypothetical protein